MKAIAVSCGSGEGAFPVYREGAARLGRELARRGIALIYGGADVGLMGAVADAVLERGGKANGVLPRFLRDREIAHGGLTELADRQPSPNFKRKNCLYVAENEGVFLE